MTLERKQTGILVAAVVGVVAIVVVGRMMVSGKGPGTIPAPMQAGERQTVDQSASGTQDTTGSAAASDSASVQAAQESAADAAAQTPVTTKAEATKALTDLDGAVGSAGTDTGE